MENQVYKCSWKRVEGGYELSTKTKPRLVTTNKSFKVAEDDLHGLVCENYGDGESVFEFDPSAPVSSSSKMLFDPQLFVLGSNDGLHQENDEQGLYSEGYCDCCKGGLGKRTKKVRTLSEAPKFDVSFLWSAKPQVKFISARLVGFLCRNGMRKSAFREVRFTSKKTPRVFEFVAEPEIEFVGVKHPPRATGGWQCAKCGMRWMHPFHRCVAPTVTNFLSRVELQRVSGKTFVTGHSYERDICMSGAMATRLRKLRGLKGILTSRVAVLDERDIVRNPKVKIVKKSGFA